MPLDLLASTAELVDIASPSFEEASITAHIEARLRALGHLEVERVGANLVAEVTAPEAYVIEAHGEKRFTVAVVDLEPHAGDCGDAGRATHHGGHLLLEAGPRVLAAFTEVGARPGDRIEHGALIPPESIDDLRRLGLRVVSQPGFLSDRGDSYLRDVDPRDRGDLYRCRSLLDAGVPLALSSDAPYGPLDPWAIIAAATTRTTESGAVLSHSEILDPSQALAGFLSAADDPGGNPRTIRIGQPGDVVLLHAPLADVLSAPSSSAVRTTVIGGRVVHG